MLEGLNGVRIIFTIFLNNIHIFYCVVLKTVFTE